METRRTLFGAYRTATPPLQGDIDMVAYYLDLVSFGDEGEIKSSAAAIDDVVERIKEAGSDEGG